MIPLAYSPLGQGRLTGKFSVANPPPKARRTSRPTRWKRSTRWWPGCAASAQAHGERTPSQVALAWIIAKGRIPIPGAKSRKQARTTPGRWAGASTTTELAELDAGRPLRHPDPETIWQHG